MQKRRINFKVFFIISIVLLMFTNSVTFVLLLTKNEEWKSVLADNQMCGSDATVVADALVKHVYYDGDSILCNQEVKHYSRFGKMIGCEKLSEVLHGEKVVMLLSSNCSMSCVTEEINKLLELTKKIGQEHLVVIADFTMNAQDSLIKYFDKMDFYETDVELCGMEGSPTRETPVVMLAQNGRVKTSFLVEPQTISFVDGFHKYLTNYFKEKK